MAIDLKPKRTERIVDASELENLFALGLQQKDVAAKLEMSPELLARKIGNSQTLTTARQRGREQAKSL